MRGSPRILVVKMGGGWLKALLPHSAETVFGRDEDQLSGRLKQIGIREPILIGKVLDFRRRGAR